MRWNRDGIVWPLVERRYVFAAYRQPCVVVGVFPATDELGGPLFFRCACSLLLMLSTNVRFFVTEKIWALLWPKKLILISNRVQIDEDPTNQNSIRVRVIRT